MTPRSEAFTHLAVSGERMTQMSEAYSAEREDVALGRLGQAVAELMRAVVILDRKVEVLAATVRPPHEPRDPGRPRRRRS